MSSKESVTRTVQAVPAIKILPPQVARLKKEEDEETWISGEELYTEGSSDEENCRCKSRSPDRADSSSLRLGKPHRSKGKLDKKKKSTSSLTSEDSMTIRSSSKEQSTPTSNVSDDEDDVISWKANRDEQLLENEILALKEYDIDYPKICKSMDGIFNEYCEKIDFVESIEKEHFEHQCKKFKDEMRENIAHFDSVITNMQNKLKSIEKETRNIQIQNRLRLKGIIAHGPPESVRLSKNTEKFLELCSDTNVTQSSEYDSDEKSEMDNKYEIEFSQIQNEAKNSSN